MNIVAIDNNRRDLSLLVDLLTAVFPPCHLQTFTDPLLSAKYICNSPVDMVLLSEDMRPVGGFVLLKVLRANKPGLFIAMLSDSGQRGEDAINARVNGYFTKPLAAETLIQLGEEMRKGL